MLPGRALARVLSLVGVTGVISAGLVTGVAWAAAPTGSVAIDAGQPTSALNSTTLTLHFTTSEVLVPGLPTTVTMNRNAAPTDQIVGTSVSVANTGLPPVSHVTATFDFNLANPNVANGAGYDVEIAQNAVDDQCGSCFHVLSQTPTVSAPSTASPTVVGEGGSVPFVITGTHFAKGPYDGTPNAGTVVLQNSTTHAVDTNVAVGPTVDGQGNPAPTSPTATTITLRLQASGTDTTDYFDDVVVTNTDNKTVTCTACVHVMPQPVISSIAGPVGSSVGLNAQGQTITLTGTNFAPDSVVALTPPGGSPSAVIHFVQSAPDVTGTTITLTGVDTRQAVAGNWVATVSSNARHNVSAGKTLTVNPAPQATSITYQGGSSDVGQGAQSRTVTVGGSGIAAGAHLVFTGLPATIATKNEAVDTVQQKVSIQLDVPTSAALASYPATIVNADGGASQPCAVPPAPFPPGGTPTPCPLAIAAAPAVSTISPNTVTGPFTGAVVLSGTNFHSGANNVHVTIAPTSGTPYLNDFQATASGSGATKTVTIPAGNINVPAGTLLSDADVTVTNADDGGTKTAVGIFHIVNLSLTGISQSVGTNDTPVTGVTVTGSNFDPTATVLLRRSGLADIPGVVHSVAGDGSSLTADFDITNAGPGDYQVIVTNPPGAAHPGTAANPSVVFTVLADAPTTSAVSPTALGGGATDVSVQVTGTHFFPGSTVSFDSPAVTLVGSPVITNGGTTITQHVSVASNVANGTTALTVTNSAGVSSNSQNVTLDAAPTVVGVAPTNHSPDAFTLSVAGTGFLSGAQLTFDDAGVHAANVQVAPDGTTLTADLTFTPGVVPGDAPVAVAVTVINPDHGQATSPGGNGLTLDPEPRITSVVPSSIPAGKGTDVQILGANFLNNATVTAPNGSGITVSNLHFISANELDATLTVAGGAARGARTLTVDNGEGGTTTKDVTVYVVPGAPQPPAGPTQVVTPGDSSLSIAWLAPTDDGGSAITGYTVTVTEHGTANSSSHSLGSGATSDSFTGLVNGTLYDVSIVAANGAGNGAALTGSGTPLTVPAVPGSLQVTSTVREIDLSWVTPNNGGSALTGYTATLTPHGGSALPPHHLAPGVTSDSFTGLTNATLYDLSLVATNAAGDSAAATGSATTPDVPAAPSLTVVELNGELDLSWPAPANGGSAITGYTATLTPHSGGTTVTHPLGAGATSDSFTGLTNGTAYDVALFATNAAGDSQHATDTKTPRAVPSAPVAIAVHAGDGLLAITWTAPANNGGNAVDHYTVSVTPHAGGSTTTFATPDASTMSHTFNGLANGALYDVSVVAHNAAGDGAASTASGTPRFVSTLSVKDSSSHVVDGTKITLSGVLTRSNKTGVAGATVTIFRKFDGKTAGRYLTLTTGPTGAWTTTFAPAFNATYYAVYAGSGSVVAATSRQVRTTVAPRVTIRSPLTKSTSSSATNLKITGKVAPNKAGRTVVLYYVTSTGKLIRLTSGKLSSTSTFVLSTRLKRGTWHLVVVIGASTGNTTGHSSTLTVKRT